MEVKVKYTNNWVKSSSDSEVSSSFFDVDAVLSNFRLGAGDGRVKIG